MKRVIGLMSGTSLDGVDAALIGTDGIQISAFGPGELRLYSELERKILQDAVSAALAWNFEGEGPDFREAESVLTHSHADAVSAVLKKSGLGSEDIDLIGFHGQTVLHKPPADGKNGQTLQIGDAQALANTSGIDIVYDFRSSDMETGGQGAPLVPLYHQALITKADVQGPVAILNLGGVANVSWLDEHGDIVSFDTGPANGLIDAWCMERIGRGFDANGDLAAAGRIDPEAMTELMKHPFFKLAPPKSLDRWDFSLEAVKHLSDADGAATLTAFTARSIADGLAHLGRPQRLFVAGGGRHNPVLMRMLAAALGVGPEPVEVLGWRGDLLEAEAFAWLAARVEAGLPTSLPSTTGTSEPVCGGQIERTNTRNSDRETNLREDQVCPICGYEDKSGDANREEQSCLCCGNELGSHDLVRGHARLRDDWVASGMKWSNHSIRPAVGWNPVSQLTGITKT